MKINGIEIKKKLVKDNDRKYYFSANKHAHDILFYHNRLLNIVGQANNEEENSAGKYLLDKYGIDFIEAIDRFNNEKVVELDNVISFNNQNGIAMLTGPEIGLAKDIVAWAEGTRSGAYGKTNIGPAWSYAKNYIKPPEKKIGDSVKDDISNAARELCREIKSLTEEDVKDSIILIGEWKFLPYDPEKYNDGYYTAVNVETGELLSDDDFEKLKSAIKYTIYSDDRYFSEKADKEADVKDSEIDFSTDYIKVKGDKVIISYDKIRVKDDDGREIKIDYDYEQDKNTVIEVIEDIIEAEEPITDEDFEKLLKEHEEEVAEYFVEKAIEEAQETFNPDEYYNNKREAEEADRVDDSEIERAYFDKDGTLVLQYYFKSKDGVNSPYGYAPKLGDIYERLYTYSKDPDSSNYEDYDEKVKYISEHIDEFIPKYEKYLLDDFRDDAEDEFYAKLFDYED